MTERNRAPVEPTAKEYSDELRRTADALKQYADRIEATNDVNADWDGDWSTHAVDAAAAVFDSMTH